LKHRKRNSLFLLLLLLFSCDITNNLTKENAVKIYVHLQIYEEQYRHSPDSLKIVQKQLFEKYNTNKQDFEQYLSGFGEDEKKWNEFFDLSLKYINELKKKEFN